MRFECVLKRLDEFRRLINVDAQVEFRRVLDQNEAFQCVRIDIQVHESD